MIQDKPEPSKDAPAKKLPKPIIKKLPITLVDYDLLLARAYTEWEGHTNDAFAVYDKVT